VNEDSRAVRTHSWLYRTSIGVLFYLALPIGAALMLVPAFHVADPAQDLLVQKLTNVMGGSVVVAAVGLALLVLAVWARRRLLDVRQAANDAIAARIMTDLRAAPAAHVPEFYL